MRLQKFCLSLLLFGATLLVNTTSARRVRVQQPVEQEDETVQYYAAEPQDDQQHVVLVSSADQYNGLYGQPTAEPRQSNYISRGSSKSAVHAAALTARTKESAKTPPVQTIRNYNKVNDDGSFTFGYEAADGSFKEETRGTDCVVRGKYGYIDPDGNKREFTYVSGNPCDPNAPKEQEELPEPESNESDNGPANYPTRPIRPVRPLTATPAPKPAVTLFQNNYAQSEEEQPEPEQLLKSQPVRRPQYISRPSYYQQAQQQDEDVYQTRASPSTTPASVVYRQSITPVSITPRPVSPTSSARTQLPATTYRPQLLQVSVTPRPSLLYSKASASPSTTPSTPRGSGNIDFDAEFQKFQQDNNIASPTDKNKLKSGQVYSSALVYDPTSGQYNTQLYQTLPQTEGDFSLNHRIQPYVHQAQHHRAPQPLHQSPLYTQHLRPQPTPQALYQQQQQELQFHNSAQLFAHQQRARGHQQQRPQQPVYYIQPHQDQNAGLAGSQIDAFLRGHNIQF